MSFLVNPYMFTSGLYANTYSMLMTRTTTSANVDRLYLTAQTNDIQTLIQSGNPRITISTWIKFSAGTDGTTMSFMSKYEDFSGRDRALILWRQADNTLSVYGQRDSSNQTLYIYTSGTTYTNSSGWFHFAFVYDSTKTTRETIAKMYINGVENVFVGTVSTTNKFFMNASAANRGAVTLGCRYGGGSPGTKIEGTGANYDDTTFWNNALSAAEILELYNSGKAKNISTMTAYTNNCKAWYRMGDDPTDNWNASTWLIHNVKNAASTDLVSQNMVEADRVTDVY